MARKAMFIDLLIIIIGLVFIAIAYPSISILIASFTQIMPYSGQFTEFIKSIGEACTGNEQRTRLDTGQIEKNTFVTQLYLSSAKDTNKVSSSGAYALIDPKGPTFTYIKRNEDKINTITIPELSNCIDNTCICLVKYNGCNTAGEFDEFLKNRGLINTYTFINWRNAYSTIETDLGITKAKTADITTTGEEELKARMYSDAGNYYTDLYLKEQLQDYNLKNGERLAFMDLQAYTKYCDSIASWAENEICRNEALKALNQLTIDFFNKQRCENEVDILNCQQITGGLGCKKGKQTEIAIKYLPDAIKPYDLCGAMYVMTKRASYTNSYMSYIRHVRNDPGYRCNLFSGNMAYVQYTLTNITGENYVTTDKLTIKTMPIMKGYPIGTIPSMGVHIKEYQRDNYEKITTVQLADKPIEIDLGGKKQINSVIFTIDDSLSTWSSVYLTLEGYNEEDKEKWKQIQTETITQTPPIILVHKGGGSYQPLFMMPTEPKTTSYKWDITAKRTNNGGTIIYLE